MKALVFKRYGGFDQITFADIPRPVPKPDEILVQVHAGGRAIYSYLQKRGWRVERDHLVVKNFTVQFLAASGLTEEAVCEAKPIEYEGVQAKVFRPEYIITIAASIGRLSRKTKPVADLDAQKGIPTARISEEIDDSANNSKR